MLRASLFVRTSWAAFIGAALPVAVSRMINMLNENPTYQSIGLVGVVLMGIGVGLWGLNWLRRSLIVRAVGDVVLDMRTRAFRAAADHDLSFYDQFSSGRIVSRINSDTNDLSNLVIIVTDVVSQFIQAIILGANMLDASMAGLGRALVERGGGTRAQPQVERGELHALERPRHAQRRDHAGGVAGGRARRWPARAPGRCPTRCRRCARARPRCGSCRA